MASRKLLLRFAHGDRHGDGQAALSGAGEGAVADDLGGVVEVGVGQHDGMVLGSALALHALAVGGGARIDVLRHRGGADETDGADLGMVEDGIHGLASAVDQTDDTLGKIQALDQAKGQLHRERHFFRRLEQEAVAAGDGVGQVPEGNHRREVERRDGGDDADGLANHAFVDAFGDVFEVVALHEHGNAAGDFDIFDGAAHLALGFGEGLAVLHDDGAGKFVDVVFEQLFECEQVLHAFARRSASPLVLDPFGGLDGGVDFGGG